MDKKKYLYEWLYIIEKTFCKYLKYYNFHLLLLSNYKQGNRI